MTGEKRKKKSESLRPARDKNTRNRKVHVREQEAILKSIKSLEEQRDQIGKKLANLEGHKNHRCIWLRNKFIKKRIQDDFAARHKIMVKSMGEQPRGMDTVEVFPVSSTAYQDFLKRLTPGAAIPSGLHTGIPRLKQWIDESTFDSREKHLDIMLLSLKRMSNDVSRWCDEQAAEKLYFSRVDVDGIIQRSGITYGAQIAEMLRRLGNNIKDMVNFGDNEIKTSQCDKVGRRVAIQWIRKFPDQEYLPTKMSCMTHYAILRRGGGPHATKSGDQILYDWPPRL